MDNGLMAGGDYAGSCEAPTPIRKQSLTDRLHGEKARLQERIKEIDSVLDAMKKVPEVEAVIDLIFKHAR